MWCIPWLNIQQVSLFWRHTAAEWLGCILFLHEDWGARFSIRYYGEEAVPEPVAIKLVHVWVYAMRNPESMLHLYEKVVIVADGLAIQVLLAYLYIAHLNAPWLSALTGRFTTVAVGGKQKWLRKPNHSLVSCPYSFTECLQTGV